jgi:hypothetical protein
VQVRLCDEFEGQGPHEPSQLLPQNATHCPSPLHESPSSQVPQMPPQPSGPHTLPAQSATHGPLPPPPSGALPPGLSAPVLLPPWLLAPWLLAPWLPAPLPPETPPPLLVASSEQPIKSTPMAHLVTTKEVTHFITRV